MMLPSTDAVTVLPYRGRVIGVGAYAKENWFACAHVLGDHISFVIFWIEPQVHTHTDEELVSRMIEKYDTGRGHEVLGYGVLKPELLQFTRNYGPPANVPAIVQRAFRNFDVLGLEDFRYAVVMSKDDRSVAARFWNSVDTIAASHRTVPLVLKSSLAA